MLAIMTIVGFDVVMRYVLNRPLGWAYDLVGLYLMPGAFFLALSSTQAAHGHIGVDMLVQRLPPKGRRLAEILTSALAIPLFALIGWAGAERAYVDWVRANTLSGSIPWPTWVSSALIPIGTGLLVLRLTMLLVGHAASLVTGTNIVPLTPAAGHDDRAA